MRPPLRAASTLFDPPHKLQHHLLFAFGSLTGTCRVLLTTIALPSV